MRLFLGFFSFASPDNSALKCVAFVQYWKIERKEKLDWPWEVSVIWMHVAMSVGPRWWDLWGRNGPWGREGRHHRSWLSGRWKGTPFSVRKSMHGPNQTARLSVFIQVKKKCSNWSRIESPAAHSSGEPLSGRLWPIDLRQHLYVRLEIFCICSIYPTARCGITQQWCLYDPVRNPRRNHWESSAQSPESSH